MLDILVIQCSSTLFHFNLTLTSHLDQGKIGQACCGKVVSVGEVLATFLVSLAKLITNIANTSSGLTFWLQACRASAYRGTTGIALRHVCPSVRPTHMSYERSRRSCVEPSEARLGVIALASATTHLCGASGMLKLWIVVAA